MHKVEINEDEGTDALLQLATPYMNFEVKGSIV